MPYYKPRRRWGRIIAIIVGVLLVGFALFGYFLFRGAADDNSKQPSKAVIDPRAAQEKANQQAASERDANNTKRHADTTALMVAVKTYLNQNSGQFPTSYAKGQLTGGPSPVPLKLSFYKTLAVLAGQQGPVTDDTLRLITKAVCGNALSASVNSPSNQPQAFVIQFSLQAGDGTLDPQCMET